MKLFKKILCLLCAACLFVSAPAYTVSAAAYENETNDYHLMKLLDFFEHDGYVVNTVELEFSNSATKTAGAGIPGNDLARNPKADLARLASLVGVSPDAIQRVEFAASQSSSANIGIPGNDLSLSLRPSVLKLSNAETTSFVYAIEVSYGSTVVAYATQDTEWEYTPGIQSRLTYGNLIFSSVAAGYSILSGGSIVTNNNDGSQKVRHYFKVKTPGGSESNWYYMDSHCTTYGTVLTDTGLLDY